MMSRLSSTLQNWISLVGTIIALISLCMIVIIFVISRLAGHSGIYLGLVVYILLPALMIAGLILIPTGMLIRRKKEKKRTEVGPEWPRIDLNLKKHRRAFVMFGLGTGLFLFISLFGSYEAFHFTESNQFCGQLCHEVMEPEYVAYQHSPHARVKCVECHVGPGADWYVRSKLSGMYQVYSTLFNKYPVPIPTPIENLRPARETCEQCHWPEQFYAHKLRFEKYYLSDEDNSEWNLRLVIKTGPEHQALGLKEGIHWHINPDVRIEYIQGDERREELPWVRYTNIKTGETTVYEDEENALDSDGPSEEDIRVMDCIDCHNRPSHNYRPPRRFINEAMTSGEMAKDLPNLKMIALELCAKKYSTREEAMQAIDDQLRSYYAEYHPEMLEAKKEKINSAIAKLQDIFAQNIFPQMKVRWDVHLNHIGHLNSEGCFRCHNARHSSPNGDRIRRDCSICHWITAQGPPENLAIGSIRQPLEFAHPVDIDEAWKEALCSDCHEGADF